MATSPLAQSHPTRRGSPSWSSGASSFDRDPRFARLCRQGGGEGARRRAAGSRMGDPDLVAWRRPCPTVAPWPTPFVVKSAARLQSDGDRAQRRRELGRRFAAARIAGPNVPMAAGSTNGSIATSRAASWSNPMSGRGHGCRSTINSTFSRAASNMCRCILAGDRAIAGSCSTATGSACRLGPPIPIPRHPRRSR